LRVGDLPNRLGFECPKRPGVWGLAKPGSRKTNRNQDGPISRVLPKAELWITLGIQNATLKEDIMKVLAPMLAMGFGVFLISPTAAEETANQPLSRADCAKAGMSWDDAANVCGGKTAAHKVESAPKTEATPNARTAPKSAAAAKSVAEPKSGATAKAEGGSKHKVTKVAIKGKKGASSHGAKVQAKSVHRAKAQARPVHRAKAQARPVHRAKAQAKPVRPFKWLFRKQPTSAGKT
jgi:hypothetical protein